LVYFDFFRLSRPRRGRFAPDLCKVPKNRPPWFYFHANDAPKEYYLLHYYAHVCSLSSLLAGVAGVEFIRGGSVILSHTLMVFAYLSLFYILWRLNTCWARIYLK
jgi:hypothetical protein